MSGRRRIEKEKGVLHFIGLGLSWGLFALVIVLAIGVIVVPFATGSTPMTVLTGSMRPTYPPGTLVIVKPIETDDIRIGDPITFQLRSGEPEVVTHRVIAISATGSELSFTTQGDNNAVPDPKSVLPVQVRGKVWYAVPYIGYVNTIVNGDNRSWIVPLSAVALFAYAGWMFASGIWQAARRRRRQRDRELVSSN